MEVKLRWLLLTAIAPIAWGSTYFVTREFLPAGSPLWGSVIRALPAGILLLLIRPRLPHGSWWWKSFVLGALNMSGFFTLVYVAAQLLPTTIASTIMATSPVALTAFAWVLLAQRPVALSLIGAGLGVVGVVALLATGASEVNLLGVLASVAALTLSSLGYILATRWATPAVTVLSSTAWQLIAGGIILIPFAALFEPLPAAPTGSEIIAFAYISIVATALAFVAWFTGLRRMDAGDVGLIGLLNPVTGVLLGTVIASEALTLQQVLGLAIIAVGIVLGQPTIRAGLLRWREAARTSRSRSGHARPGSSVRRGPSRRAAPRAEP